MGLNLTVADCHRMFYTLANIHHQIVTREKLPPVPRFWCTIPNLPYRIRNAATIFQFKVTQLMSGRAPYGGVLTSAK